MKLTGWKECVLISDSSVLVRLSESSDLKVSSWPSWIIVSPVLETSDATCFGPSGMRIYLVKRKGNRPDTVGSTWDSRPLRLAVISKDTVPFARLVSSYRFSRSLVVSI